MLAFIASTIAALLVALAAVMLGSPAAVLFIALACGCAFVTHTDAPEALRAAAYSLAIIITVGTGVYLLYLSLL